MADKKKKRRKPYNKSTGRNYKRDYKKFQGTAEQKARRAKRGRDRYKAEKEGRVKKGQDLHHKKNGKTVAMSPSKNRGLSEKSRLKGSKRKKRC